MPCSHGYKSPREYYEIAKLMMHDECLRVFGRTGEEILLALQCYDDVKYIKEQSKMTREEARNIVFNKCKQLEGKEAGYLIDALEALGLLKFNEVSTVKDIITTCFISVNAPKPDLCAIEVVNMLERNGYMIIRKLT